MSQQQNVRVRRTHKLLREALIGLIEERGFDGVTIGELTARALVSRAAFYRAYQDKYDLVEQIFAEAMSGLPGTIATMDTREHPPRVWVTFFEHITAYAPLYRALLGRKGSPWFVWKMRAALAELVKEHERPLDGTSPATRPVVTFADTFVPDLVAAMFVDAIIWWLEQGMPYTPEEMSLRCARLASALFKEVQTWQ